MPELPARSPDVSSSNLRRMTSETLAKSLEGERSSSKQAIALLLLVMMIGLGLYWVIGLVSARVEEPGKHTDHHDDEMYEPTDDDYDYLDDDDFIEPEEEDYDLLEEASEEIDYDEEESPDDLDLSNLTKM